MSASSRDSAYSYTFFHSAVCLSVTLMTMLKAFNGFKYHLAATLVSSNDTSCWDPQLQIAAATWRMRFRSWLDSDSAFYEITSITLVLACGLCCRQLNEC